jgi:hypothetical protein
MTLSIEEEQRIGELYDKLAAWGINVDAVQKRNLTLHDLEDFHRRIVSLIQRRVWETKKTHVFSHGMNLFPINVKSLPM